MSTLHQIDGQYIMYTKGALDVILDRAPSLTEEQKQEIRDANFDLSNQGLRVLAFARKVLNVQKIWTSAMNPILNSSVWLLKWTSKEESAQAVTDCIEAGIKPIMITGDHKITASAIAKRIGILREEDIAVTGTELDAMSDDELIENFLISASMPGSVRITKSASCRPGRIKRTS